MSNKRTIHLAASYLLATALTGCTVRVVENRPSDAPPVRLTASTLATESRSAIQPGDSFTAAVAGWETAASAADYTMPQAWTAAFTVVAGTSLPVALTPEVYYNVSANIKTYIKAWYPAGTLGADGKVLFEGSAAGTPPNGTVDVLLTPVVTGSRDDTGGKHLEFRHLLSQLRFRIRAAAGVTAQPTLTSITVHGVRLPVGIDLAGDEPLYAPAADFTVAGIEPGSVAFTTTAQSVGRALLLQPFQGNTLTVDIVTSEGTHAGVVATIDDDERFMPGKAYTITLTYTGQDVKPFGITVGVAPWKDVIGGDAEA